MDRYLFRGKRTDTGEWRTGYLVEYCEKGELIYYISQNDTSSGIFRMEIDPATVGQATGLLAAKSYRGESEDARMIFEGDKTRLVFRDGEVEDYVVCWDKERLRFVLEEIGTGIKWGFDNTNKYEIIGTIFDVERSMSNE